MVMVVGYGVYATHRLLRTWQPDHNVLLTAGENILRLVLIVFCVLLGLISGLRAKTSSGWRFSAGNATTSIGLASGCLLALFFYGATQWVIQRSGQRFYSSVVIKAIVPAERTGLLLVSLAMLPIVALEELLFRSLLVGGLTPLLPASFLVIATSLLFGLLHLPQGLWGITGATLAGLLFGLLFIEQGSLLAPFIAHYVANIVQVGQAMRLRDQL